MKGISIYFGLDNNKKENLELLNKAYKLGYKIIFTSLHIPEANYDVLKKEVKEFLEIARAYNMDVISDISPNTFKFLDIKNMDLKALNNLGIKTIRIDFGYSEEDIAIMSNNEYDIKIQFNASTITEEFFERLDRYNPNYNNIDALHNFYPRVGTGLSIECFQGKNDILRKRNIKVAAFVQSNYKKRSPLKDGLPTLEDHRGEDIRVATNHLYALGVSDIFIGDSLPSDEELKAMAELKNDIIEIRVKLISKDNFTKKLLKKIFTARADEARDAIRANESRLLLDGNIINEENNIERKKGYITLDNNLYGRYMGELQIMKVNSNADKRTNVVGIIDNRDMRLLKHLKNNKAFRFKEIE